MGSQERRAAIVSEAMTWLRTPYHHNARVKGAGVDCAQLPAAVYEAAGLIAHVEPQYAHDWHLHRNRELYLEWAEKLGAIEIEPEDAGPGDFIIWKFGRTFSHGAIFTSPPMIIHANQFSNMVSLDDWTTLEDLARRERRCFTFWKAAE